jgi:hypothetical protein
MADEVEEIDKELENLSPEDKKVVYDEFQRVFGQEKIGNIHEFLAEVIKKKDTTKMGYLSKEELGNPLLTLRGYKELAIMAKTFEMPIFSDYFEDMAINAVTSPSLSKEGFLMLLAITEKRSLQARLPSQERKENKGWFGRKKSPTPVSDYNY